MDLRNIKNIFSCSMKVMAHKHPTNYPFQCRMYGFTLVSVCMVSKGQLNTTTLAFSTLVMSPSTCRLNTMPWIISLCSRPLPRILHTRTLSTLKDIFAGRMDTERTSEKVAANKIHDSHEWNYFHWIRNSSKEITLAISNNTAILNPLWILCSYLFEYFHTIKQNSKRHTQKQWVDTGKR